MFLKNFNFSLFATKSVLYTLKLRKNFDFSVKLFQINKTFLIN